MASKMTCKDCVKKKPKNQFSFLPGFGNAENKPCAKSRFCHDCQSKHPPAQFVDYQQRNRILKEMGFESYDEYLRSELWNSIRFRLIRSKGFTCECCGKRASQVHHSMYRKENLTGQSLRGMKAVCRDCHRLIEFDGDRKTGFIEATLRCARMISLHERLHGSTVR